MKPGPRPQRKRDELGRIVTKTRGGMRRCSRCRLDKPLAEYDRRTLDSRYYNSACRDCRRAIAREAHKRLMADRERREQRQVAMRMRAAMLRRDAGVPQAPTLRPAAEGYVPPVAGTIVGRKLDAAPLAEWLRFEYRGWAVKELAGRLGVEEATLRRLINGQSRYVSLHVADRILVGADCVHLLALLYPEDVAA